MYKRELRVNLQNIKELYPLFHQSENLGVNIKSMSSEISLIAHKERDKTIRCRQTARKSTNSKLKFVISDRGLELPFPSDDNFKSAPSTILNCDSSSENSLCSKSDSISTVTDTSEVSSGSATSNSVITDVISSEKYGNIDGSFFKCSTPDISGKPRHSSIDATPVNAQNNCKDSESSRKVDPIKLKIKNIIPNETLSENSSSEESTFSTNEQSDPKVDSIKLKLKTTSSPENVSDQAKPPIKIFVANINNCPTIQNPTKAESENESEVLTNGFSNNSHGESRVPFKNTVKDHTEELSDNGAASIHQTSKTPSVEDVVNNMKTKQNKGKRVSDDTESSGTLKRTLENSCDLDQSSSKKPKVSNGYKLDSHDPDKTAVDSKVNGVQLDNHTIKKELDKKVGELKWSDCKPEIEKFIQDCCHREIQLQVKLEKKNEKYSRLKSKYDSLEETFRSWIKFADDLQTRVRKMALHFQRQGESVKVLKTPPKMTSVAIQTDKVRDESLSDAPKPLLSEQFSSRSISPKKNSPLSKSNALHSPIASSKANNSPVTVKSSADIIDLTEETDSNTSSHINQEVQRILQLRNTKNHTYSKLQSNTAPAACTAALQRSPLGNASTLHGTPGRPFKVVANTSSVCYGDQRSNIPRQPFLRAPPSNCRTNNNQSSRKSSYESHMSLHQRATSVVRNLHQTNPIPSYPPLPGSVRPFSNKIPRNALGPPPELQLAIKKQDGHGGIVLSWTNRYADPRSAKVVGYELYAFHQPTNNEKREWRKIGDDTIKAMDLPMACTLSQFSSNCVYFFAVRGKDVFGRFGPFSAPCSSKDVT